jgi:hypothetical protein
MSVRPPNTRLPAYVHRRISPSPVPLLSRVVYVRAHQIILACLLAPGGPATSRRTALLEIELLLEYLNGYKVVQELYRFRGIRRALHNFLRNSIDVVADYFCTTYIVTASHVCKSSKSGFVLKRSAEHAKQRSRARVKVNASSTWPMRILLCYDWAHVEVQGIMACKHLATACPPCLACKKPCVPCGTALGQGCVGGAVAVDGCCRL